MMLNISAIVVTYNRLKLLKKCINHLLRQSYKLTGIFIINNHSTDNTRQYLNIIQHKSLVHVVNLNKNIGGAGGFNLGLKEAYKCSNSSAFWLMDDDVMPLKNSLKYLVKATNILHYNFGFLCSNVRWHKKIIPSISNVPNVSFDWNKLLNNMLIKINSATFVSFFVLRKNVQKYGFPISDMFIWGDDTEYTTRLSNKLNSYFVMNSIVIHESVSNVSNTSLFNAPLNRAKFYEYMYRNLFYISRKYQKKSKTVKLLLTFLYELLKTPFRSKNHRIIRTSFILKGILKGLWFNPKIEFPSKKIINHNK